MTPKQKGNLLVVGQFALLIAMAVLPQDSGWIPDSFLGILDTIVFALGWLVLIWAGINLGRSLTANPVPLEKAKLKTTGLYAVVRHPIYLGLILIGLAMSVKANSLLSYLLLALLILLLNFKARFEEQMLNAKFTEYAAYATRVGRLFPGIGRIKR